MNLRTAVFLLFAISMTKAQEQEANPKADAIFLHGNIYTGVAVVSSFHEIKRAEAMALRGGRIQAVGAESDILKLKGPQTEVINLNGRFVMPGFNDAHLHLASAGFERLTVNLAGVKSLTEFRDRIRAHVETAGPGEWIVGRGWDHTLWPVKELPSRWDIDEVATDHPVFLQRVDGHIAVANTRALQLASITIASKDPAGGKIDRDSTGQPTGILRETARAAVESVIPKPTHDKRWQALEAALQDLAQWGITSAQDNSSWEDFQIYEEIEREGKLTARITEWLAFDDPLNTLQAHRTAHSQSDNMLHTGMLKGFMDGSLGSRTAALIEPYADDANNSGLPQYDQAKLTQMTKER
ncbi:MAG TPA: amidohydrolase, partial [Terriglobales bacterium]|nr:amidohydrolase [Terriglobales bacterium]